MIKLFRRSDKILLLILAIAFLLRIIGLTPNFLQHPDEPVVINPASKIAINLILHFNPDPNVEVPYPFQYATALFYFHALIQIVVLGSGYALYKIFGFSFELSQSAFAHPSFTQFLTDIGPTAMSYTLLWFHRLPSVFFGVATVFLVYKTAFFLLKNRQIALISALSLAVLPHHVRDSHWATVNIIQAFFFLFAFYRSAKAWEKTTSKNWVFAGISTGFAISIKYFPLPLIPFFFFLFLSRKRLSLNSLFIIFFSLLSGYLLGMPYLFIYLQKIVEYYKFTVAYYSPDKALDQSIFQRILPSYLHMFHLGFFFKNAVGPIPSVIGVLGVIIGLRQSLLITVSLLIIPVINLLFISLYLETIYETLTIPALPFFAIFTGVGCWWLINHLKRHLNILFSSTILLGIVFLLPFINSAQASFACTKTITEFEAHDWIANNIPEGAKLAFQPNMRLPSKNFDFIRSEPKEKFLLSEIQEAGAEYVALHSGYTDRYAQWLDDNILLPKYIKDNEFTHLALQEFETSAQLLKLFVRPTMCVNSRIYIYKVPPPFIPSKTLMAKLNFDHGGAPSGWKLGNEESPSGVNIDLIPTKNGIVARYHYNPDVFLEKINRFSIVRVGLPPSFYGTPFRSPFIKITPGKKYSATLAVKRQSTPGKIPDAFARLDFYSEEVDSDDKDKNIEPILTRLSRRLTLENDGWQVLNITALAPLNARSATISFQPLIATRSSDYLIKEATLFD